MRPFLLVTLMAALAALGALAGCGEDREGSVTTQTGTGTTGTGTTGTETTATTVEGPPVATVRVSETEYELDPANPKVKEAGVVEFRVRNDGKVAHALEVEGPKGEVETENIQPGKSAKLKADLSEPGRYVWYCPVGNHKELGMEGRITVAGGGGAGGGTAAPKTETDGGGGSGY